MELHVLLFCISIILLCISPFLNRKQPKKLPPGPPGLPIFGSLPHLGSLPHEKLAEWAKQYGPFMTVKFGFNTKIVVSTAEAAKDIFQRNDLAFDYRPNVDVTSAVPNAEGLIGWVPPDEKWRYKRRICSNNLFTSKHLDSLQDIFDKKCGQLIAHVQKHCNMGTEVDFGQLAFATILNMMSNIIFSVDIVHSGSESAGKFKEHICRIMELTGKPNVSDCFPMLRKFDLQGINRRVRHSYLSLYEILDELIEKRLEAKASSRKRFGDFLDVLLDDSQKEGSPFNSQNMKTLILELFFAGSDTSSITIEWAMAELLKNPDEMQKARKELLKVIGGNRSSLLLADIEKLPQLQAILKETLRLHPSALIPHMAGRDVQIKGYSIKHGTQVLINSWAISRDPNYWDDPLSFKPERFLNSSVDFKGNDFRYIPFGAGRRICPGWPLANRMIINVLAAMICTFNWRLPEGVTPENLDMRERFGITLSKDVPLRVFPTMYM